MWGRHLELLGGDIKLYSLDTEVSSALQMITPPSYGLGPLLLPIKRVTLLRSARRQKTFLEEDISYNNYDKWHGISYPQIPNSF